MLSFGVGLSTIVPFAFITHAPGSLMTFVVCVLYLAAIGAMVVANVEFMDTVMIEEEIRGVP